MDAARAADLVEVPLFPLLPLGDWPAVAADLRLLLETAEHGRRRLWKKYAALQDAIREWAVACDCGEPIDPETLANVLAGLAAEPDEKTSYEET